MCKDLRFKHSVKKRAESVKLFEQGFGYKAAATILKISRYTVKEWYWVYKALGEAGLLDMGKTQTKYTFEQKLCAVRAVVDEGLTKQQVLWLNFQCICQFLPHRKFHLTSAIA